MPHGGFDEIPRVGVSFLLLGCCTRCPVDCSVNICIRTTRWPVLFVVEIIYLTMDWLLQCCPSVPPALTAGAMMVLFNFFLKTRLLPP